MWFCYKFLAGAVEIQKDLGSIAVKVSIPSFYR